MYVCMYICMYVCMYVYMYVCIYNMVYQYKYVIYIAMPRKKRLTRKKNKERNRKRCNTITVNDNSKGNEFMFDMIINFNTLHVHIYRSHC